jgi:translation elongation factor EF-1alpha
MTIDPETSDISTYQFINDESEVAIVDTPGFDDNRPHMSDSKLLEDITKFLLKRYAPRPS